jgi:hypothetical protein
MISTARSNYPGEWNQMKKLYRGSYIDASCQVWLHLAMQFQRRRFFLTLANQKQELPLAAIFVGGMGRNEEIYRGPYIDLPVSMRVPRYVQKKYNQSVKQKYSYIILQ